MLLVSVPAVGFTAKSIKEVSPSGVMTFYDAYTNTGNSYSLTTGAFICKTPGYYFFLTSLLKAENYNGSASCHIMKNGNTTVYAYSKPGTTSNEGYAATVNGAYVHLDTEDIVTLKKCSKTVSWSTSYGASSFSGLLITPDAD